MSAAIIVHADIPSLHRRKAFKVQPEQTLEGFLKLVLGKITDVNLAEYCMYRKLPTGSYVQIEGSETIKALALENNVRAGDGENGAGVTVVAGVGVLFQEYGCGGAGQAGPAQDLWHAPGRSPVERNMPSRQQRHPTLPLFRRRVYTQAL